MKADNMTLENEEPPSMTASPSSNGDAKAERPISFIKRLFKIKQDASLRETIEEYIEDDSIDEEESSVSEHEKTIISNVLELSDMCAADVMIPRADIVAINDKTTQKELFELFSERQYSRLPVYTDTLDNVIGSIHVKDIMASIARKQELDISSLVRDVPIVSPSMKVLDLLLQIRETKKHMVLVVDEFGGIDGLITIGDVIESIVGEIDDEHDPDDDQPEIIIEPSGEIIADARANLEEFEEQFGKLFSKEEHDENHTLGGLVFSIAGRVPARGEVLTHKKTGIVFEIIEADPRRIKRLCIRNMPTKAK